MRQTISSDFKLGILGGFAGNTKINGVEFGQIAVKIKTLWTD